MADLTQQQIDGLLAKIESKSALTADDLQKLGDLLKALAVTVRAQDEQIRYFESLVAILRDSNAAAIAASNAAVNALKVIAPPTATIDADVALKQIAKLRDDIKNSVQLSQTVAAVSKFAIDLAGKFI
jgi:hypothetical protein